MKSKQEMSALNNSFFRHTGEYPEGHESRYPEHIENTGFRIKYGMMERVVF
jgi:hypothetical protein